MKDIKLSKKEKELLNLGISIATGCQPCTRYHIKKCKETGMSDASINNVINITEKICNKAIEIITVKAYTILSTDSVNNKTFHLVLDNKTDIHIGLAVAYTLNSCVLFEEFLDQAQKLGVALNEISEIIETTWFIYNKAKAHIEILSDGYGIEQMGNKRVNNRTGCKC